MMYLDDFVESIETIPQDMKHYFSHMRSLDLRVSNTYDVNQKRFRQLCKDAPKLSQGEIKQQYGAIRKELATAIEHAEEKVQLSTQTHDIIDRQIRRIELEISKFQKELETARPGVTEGLAQQSLALDSSSSQTGTGAAQPEASRKRQRDQTQVAAVGAVNTDDLKRHQRKVGTVTLKRGAQKAVAAGRIPPVPAIIPPLELSSDPNEPRYCICHQVSYGEMVGCDNDNCQIEWFHYPCVGITEPPKGKWYCPDCLERDKKHKRKRMG